MTLFGRLPTSTDYRIVVNLSVAITTDGTLIRAEEGPKVLASPLQLIWKKIYDLKTVPPRKVIFPFSHEAFEEVDQFWRPNGTTQFIAKS